MILGGYYPDNYEPSPPRPGSLDDALGRGFDVASAPSCQDCGTAIHDGNTCVECWRDRRELAIARDREWWS